MSFPLNYTIKELPVEKAGIHVRQKRYPVRGAGKPQHIVWAGRYVWFTGSANCIGSQLQASGEIKLFPRQRGVCPTRIAEWPKLGESRLLYIDPEGGIVGSINDDGHMSEQAFPGARPQTLMQDTYDVWIGCSGAPFLLRAKDDAISGFSHQTPRSADAVSRGPDGYVWYFSADTLKGVDIERGIGPTWKLPATFHVHDLRFHNARGHAYYCDGQRDVIGQITDIDKVVEYQLPKGTAPRRVLWGPKGTFWFTGRGGRSLFYIDAGVAVELPSAHADADLFEFDLGADDTLWFTEPNTSCISSLSTNGL